jgi:hypothetical protein
MNRLVDDDRPAVCFLNFKRPVYPDPYVSVGPNAFDERLWPVSISADKKRVGYSPIAPKEKE